MPTQKRQIMLIQSFPIQSWTAIDGYSTPIEKLNISSTFFSESAVNSPSPHLSCTHIELEILFTSRFLRCSQIRTCRHILQRTHIHHTPLYINRRRCRSRRPSRAHTSRSHTPRPLSDSIMARIRQFHRFLLHPWLNLQIQRCRNL